MSSSPKAAKSEQPPGRRKQRGFYCVPVHTWLDRETDLKLGARAAERGISKPELLRTLVERAVGSTIWSPAERIILTETIRNQELELALIDCICTPEQSASIRAWVHERASARADDLMTELDTSRESDHEDDMVE